MNIRKRLARRVLLSRAARTFFAVATFLTVALNSPPTNPSIPELSLEGGPTADEARILDHLTHWVLEGAAPAGDLAVALRSRSRSFELFRSHARSRVRKDLVLEMPFGELLWRSGQRADVDPLLLAAIVQTESGFDPEAVSVQGALGLMQVMPETAALYLVSADPLDPAINLEVGARYFGSLLHQFDGDLPLALAAYNAGPGNVIRFAGMPPFRETRRYVQRVLARYVGHLQRAWRGSGELDWLVVDG